MEGYWCYWHGGKGYSGVALHVSKDARARAPRLLPSRVRLRKPHRHRRPRDRARRGDRRVGLRAERRQGLPGQDAVSRGDGRVRRVAAATRAAARAVRRHERRAHRARRPPEGAQAARDRPAAGGARADRAHPRRAASSTSAARSIPTTTGCSPGGRRGATCASGTSAGGSTTCSRARRSPRARRRCPVQKDVGTSDHAPVVATFA